MTKINPNYLKLQGSYLFPEIDRRVHQFQKNYPETELLNLGIGDISQPISPSIVRAIIEAMEEMGHPSTFRGYGPSQGYAFLRESICAHDYKNLPIHPDEIFISDGTKCDLAQIQHLFSPQARIALCDPAYPVYVDSNVLAGRSGRKNSDGTYSRFLYLPCTEENDFTPSPPKEPCDLIYLCSPHNPTGVGFSKKVLEEWVEYAHKYKALLLFDGAYEAFISQPHIPHSIYEIPEAREVAIELRSFSKTAGFTGLRCSYFVFPKTLQGFSGKRAHLLYPLWKRRTDTQFGGVAYPVQRGAAAIYSPEGQIEIKQAIQNYLERASLLKKGLEQLGYRVFGGIDSPYLWCQTPMPSWDFFDFLLRNQGIITIPGKGFGPSGEGYIRFSCFASQLSIEKALNRLKSHVTHTS